MYDGITNKKINKTTGFSLYNGLELKIPRITKKVEGQYFTLAKSNSYALRFTIFPFTFYSPCTFGFLKNTALYKHIAVRLLKLSCLVWKKNISSFTGQLVLSV